MSKKESISPMVFMCIVLIAVSFAFTAERAKAQSVDLRLGHWMSIKHCQSVVCIDWAKKINEASKGRINVKVFPAGALGKPQSQYPSAVSGAMDIAFTTPAMMPGRFPLTSFQDLPFLFRTAEQASIIFWKTYEKFMQDEYKDVKVLWMNTTEPGMIHTTKKPVRTLEDLEGLRLSCPNAVSSNVVAKLGAVPLTGIITDFYESMERGVTGGIQLPINTMIPFRFQELCKYHTMVDLMVAGFAIVMNRAKYEGLPADLKRIIDENSGLEWAIAGGRAYDADAKINTEAVQKDKHTLITLSTEERARWVQRAMPVREEWVQKMEQKGLPGKELLKYVEDLKSTYK